MAVFCIPKEKIANLQRIIKNISDKNQLEALSNKSSEERIALFNQVINREEADLLNYEFERAIASERAANIKNWVRRNLDAKYRETSLNESQRKVIERYIEQRKSTGKRLTKPMKEILSMNQEEQLTFLKSIMPADEAIKAQQKIQKVNVSKIDQMIDERLANFKTLKAFNKFIDSKMNMFAEMKEGIGFTSQESEDIIRLSSKIQDIKTRWDKDSNDPKLILEYGRARGELNDYVTSIKAGGPKDAVETIYNLSGLQKTIQLGIDLGSTSIQGAGTLLEKEAWKGNWQGLKNSFNKKELEDMKARIIGHPLYDIATRNGKPLRLPLYATELFQKEEAAMFNKFKSNPKFPIFSKLLGGVNETIGFFERYVAALSQTRFELFKQMYNASKNAGLDVSLNSKELNQIIDQINTMSGASSLGMFEKSATEANQIFLSARLLFSKFKNLYSPVQVIEHYARKAAGKPTRFSDVVMKKKMKTILGIVGAHMAFKNMFELMGYDVENDPRSSDFGKVRLGNRMVDLTFGYGSYLTFLARIMSGQTKSSDTGIVSRYKTVFHPVLTEEEKKQGKLWAVDRHGAPMGYSDIAINFFRNKLAAFPATIADFLAGETRAGEVPTLTGEIKDRIPPMLMADLWDIMAEDDNAGIAEKFISSILSTIGFPGYTRTAQQWESETSNEKRDFVKKVGPEKAREASKLYFDEVTAETKKITSQPYYQKMTDEKKRATLTSMKKRIKSKIFAKYGFVPKK